MNCDPKFVTFYVVVAKAIVLLLVKAKPRHGRRCIVYTLYSIHVQSIRNKHMAFLCKGINSVRGILYLLEIQLFCQ